MPDSDEISRLVNLLGCGDAAAEERALALLAIHGRKAVEDLLVAAASNHAPRRAAAATALGRVGDPRGRRTLMLALADRSVAVRAAAATALSAFPSEDTVSRLAGLLAREAELEVRLRTAATLVDLFNSGTVEALDPLLGLLRDREEARQVRLEALRVLASLPPREARAVAQGLTTDPDAKVAQATSRYTGPAFPAEAEGTEVPLAELDSPDYFTYRKAATLLASLGEPVIPTLVKQLRARFADAAACARVASVLREVARGRERSVARYLDDVEELVPLGLMVDIIGESRDRTALYYLKGVIDRLESDDPLRAPLDGGPELARQMIIAKAHYYLARAGSRVAFDSLKEILTRASRVGGPLMGEVLLATQELGGREELLDLLALYMRQDGWMRERIRLSFQRLMKKARVRADDKIFQRVDESRRAALAELLSGPEAGENRASRPRPAASPPRRPVDVGS